MPDNAFIEAFNGRFGRKCPNTHWLMTLANAAEKMEAWVKYYTDDRPHGTIGNKSPILLQKVGYFNFRRSSMEGSGQSNQ